MFAPAGKGDAGMHAGRYAQDAPRDARMAERNRNDATDAQWGRHRSLSQDTQQCGRESMLRTGHYLECALLEERPASIYGV